MPVAALLPKPKRRRGPPPKLVPTPELRLLVGSLIAFNVSEDAVCDHLRRECGISISRGTLHKQFRDEIKFGRERVVTTLGQRLYAHAMGDGVHCYSALTFLLRTIGGPMWRRAKDGDEDAAAASAAAAGPVTFYLPTNFRDVAEGAEPLEIDAEAEEAAA